MPDIIETIDAAGSTATTFSLGMGQVLRGQLSSVGDVDYYRVSLVAGQTYTAALVGTGVDPVRNTNIEIRDSAGVLIGNSDDSLPNFFSTGTFTATTSGTYYLVARASSDALAGQYGLTFTDQVKPSFDGEMGAGIVSSFATWSAANGQAASVTFGFRQTAASYTLGNSDISTFTQLSATQQVATRQALAQFSEVSGLTFVDVNPNGFTDAAAILIGNYNDADDGYGAFAYFPGNTADDDQSGDIWLNVNSVSTSSLPPGEASYFTLLHEIGHAVGLSHPGLYNAAPGLNINYIDNAQFVQDSNQYSVMSYFGGWETGASSFSYPTTLMINDIEALQNKYGVNLTTRAGNTVYGFNSTAGALYDFALQFAADFAIWDGTGTDTIDASGYTMNQKIDLRGGGFSDIGGGISNISIAYRAAIENAIGGAGNDTIIGNDAANQLIGGAGNDNLTSAGGNDTFKYLAANNGIDQVNGGDGQDTVDLRDLGTYIWADLAFAGTEVWTYLNNAWLQIANTTSVENVVGSNFGDRIWGDAGNNTLRGLDGADIIEGRAGADVIIGGTGNDSLSGGAGDDRFVFSLTNNGIDQVDGGADFDTLDFEDLPSYAWVDLAYIGIEAYTYTTSWVSLANTTSIEGVIGSTFGDRIWGDAVANRLFGGQGADNIDGRAGNDTLQGGTGNDILFGGSDNDTFVFEAINNGVDQITGGLGADTLDFSAMSTYAWVDLAYIGIEAYTYTTAWLQLGNVAEVENVIATDSTDRLWGDANANTFFGKAGNDNLDGRGGADYLEGGAGNDLLTGGLNGDTFRFQNYVQGVSTMLTGTDTITDWQDGSDKISIGLSLDSNFAGLTFTGQGTTQVTVSGFNTAGSIVVRSATSFTLDASDFIFA